MNSHILVVEDDPAWSELVKDILTKKGYRVTVTDNADGALQALRGARPELAIMDINLKGISGIKLCQMVREDPVARSIPILMLTVLKEVEHRVRGLDAGADDYLGKPFAKEELVARVKALLRRGPELAAPANRLKSGDLLVDLDRHEASLKGKPLVLRPKEFDLLVLLMRNKGRVLRREFIAESVWGQDLIVTSQTLAQHMKNLRSKLGKAADLIETIETVGYKFADA